MNPMNPMNPIPLNPAITTRTLKPPYTDTGNRTEMNTMIAPATTMLNERLTLSGEAITMSGAGLTTSGGEINIRKMRM